MIDSPVLQSDPPLGEDTWRKFVNLILVFAAFELVMGIRNLLVLDAPANLVMFVAQEAVALFFLGSWLLLRRREAFTYEQGQIALAIGLSLLVVIPLEQALTGNGMLVANLCLVLLFASATLTDTRLFVLVVSILLAAWAMAVSTRDDWNPAVSRQIVLVGIALLLGSALHAMHVWDRLNLRRAWDHALHNSMRDDLTGLWNRRGVRDVLASMVGGMRSTGMGIWCVFMDVRGLKRVNDTYGHAAGDSLLRSVGAVLNSTQDVGMVPARWGGDEFCVFGPAALSDPETLVTELRRRMREEAAAVPGSWDISFGWAALDQVGDEAVVDTLVAAADADMYRRRAESGT